ncbi:MAG: site-2 protease family protein [Candidatus Thorarchaeota archaeon]
MDPSVMFIVAIAIVYLSVYLVARRIGIERLRERGLELGTPFFIMVKTRRLNEFLSRSGRRIPRVFFSFGIVMGFLGMILGFWLLLNNMLSFFIAPDMAGPVVPIIPGVTITGLPLLYVLLGLAIALVTHEFAHGLAAGRDNIPIKSSGLLSLVVLFGAFVEPDESIFQDVPPPCPKCPDSSGDAPQDVPSPGLTDDFRTTKQRLVSRMRLLAAGSFSNMIWSGVMFLLLFNHATLMTIAFNPPSGAFIYQIEDGSPASQVLQVGDVVIGLNDTEIRYWYEVSLFMVNATAGSQLTIHTLRGNFSIVLAPSKSNATRGYIGIYGADYWSPKSGWEWIPGGPMFAFHTQQALFWSYMILLSIALFNLLPVPPLDGDRLLSSGLNLLLRDSARVKIIMQFVRLLTLTVILTNIGFTLYLQKGLF